MWLGIAEEYERAIHPGGVLKRNLGRGVQPTQQNPDPVQDTKDVNFATLSKRKCRNFLPCSRLDQGGEKEKIYGDALFKT